MGDSQIKNLCAKLHEKQKQGIFFEKTCHKTEPIYFNKV